MTGQNDGTDGDWSAWIIHDGRGCPLPTGTVVEIVSEDGFGFAKRDVGVVTGGSYSSWNWFHYPELKRIIRYRFQKARGMKILEEQMRTMPAPTRKRDVKRPKVNTL